MVIESNEDRFVSETFFELIDIFELDEKRTSVDAVVEQGGVMKKFGLTIPE